MMDTCATSLSDEVLSAPAHFSEQYRNKVIVAPMVRVGTLPFRLLALDYGADLVYSEETIDWKILRSRKRYNESLGTTEFIDRNDGTVFLSTCEKERSKLIVQIGTCDPDRALKVAQVLEPYVAGIDINMGCPKEFSIKGGMGSALLTQPKKIQAILTTLVKGLKVPVTCKIRILPQLADTLELCRLIERCGVAAVAVHARRKEERPQHPNNNSVIAEIAKVLKIPVIANGGSKDITKYSDIAGFCEATKTCSVMIARAVMWNCSILRKEGPLPVEEVIRGYLRYCMQYDNPFTFTKYTVQNMLRDKQETLRGRAFLETQTMREISKIWDLEAEYDAARQVQQDGTMEPTMTDQRRWCYESREEVETLRHTDETGCTTALHMPMQFIRGNFCNADLPKMVLDRHLTKNGMDNAEFGVINKDRYFLGYLKLDNIQYQTTCIEKSRRYAEQAAAMVYLHAKDLVPASYGFVAASGSRKYQHLAACTDKISRAERQQEQANKAHMGRNRRRQQGREASAAAGDGVKNCSGTVHETETDASVRSDVLVASDSNKERNTCQHSGRLSFENSSVAIDKEKREHCPSSPLQNEQNKNKVFIRSKDEENLTATTEAIKLDSSSQVLCFTDETATR